jgi:hypothetical protein
MKRSGKRKMENVYNRKVKKIKGRRERKRRIKEELKKGDESYRKVTPGG